MDPLTGPIQLTRIAVCASFMMNFYELVIYFPEEVQYIWMTIRDFSVLKACFIFARYFIFVLHYLHFKRGDIPEFLDPTLPSHREIENWLFFKNCCFQVLVWTVDFPVMKRAYLSYNRQRWVYRFLCCLGVAKLYMDYEFGYQVYQARLNEVYSTSRVPEHLLPLFSVPELLLHSICAALGFHASHVYEQFRTPVTTRLRANGSEAMMIGTFSIVVMIMYVYAIDLTPVLYPFITMSLSIIACRVILSLHRSFYRKPRTHFDVLSSESSDEDEDDTPISPHYDSHLHKKYATGGIR